MKFSKYYLEKSRMSSTTVSLKNIIATIKPSTFTEHIINAVRTARRSNSMVLKSNILFEFSFQIPINNEVVSLSIPTVDFELAFDNNNMKLNCLYGVDTEITQDIIIDETYDVVINGFSVFDSMINKDSEDEFHMDSRYALIVEKARMLHDNMDQIMQSAKAKTDFSDRWNVDYSHIFNALQFALRICGIIN
jgi:hypothetical protein